MVSLAEELKAACWLLGVVTYCPREWREPTDAQADVDELREPDDDQLDPAECGQVRRRRRPAHTPVCRQPMIARRGSKHGPGFGKLRWVVERAFLMSAPDRFVR